MSKLATAPVRRATFDKTSQRRRSMLAKINIARSQLNMAEDDYRQLLLQTTGEISLRVCSDGQLDQMIAALKKKGFTPLPKKGAKAAQHPMARKARALWISLHQLGVVRNPSEQALEGFAKRQLGCDRLVWARQSDAYRLIEALKAMAIRHGWQQTSPATGKKMSPIELQCHLCELILGRLKKAGAVPRDWSLDIAAMRLCGVDTSDTETGYTAEHYARLAQALGTKLRELAAAEPEA